MSNSFAVCATEEYLDLLGRLIGKAAPELYVLDAPSVLPEALPFVAEKAWDRSPTPLAILERVADILRNPLVSVVAPSVVAPTWAGFAFVWTNPETLSREAWAVDPVGRFYQARPMWEDTVPTLAGVLEPAPSRLVTALRRLSAGARSLRGWMSLN